MRTRGTRYAKRLNKAVFRASGAPLAVGLGKSHQRGRVELRSWGNANMNDPARALHYAIKDALDPTKQPGPVRTLADMSPEERAELTKLYNRPGKG